MTILRNRSKTFHRRDGRVEISQLNGGLKLGAGRGGSLTWERQDYPHLYCISDGSHRHPFLLMGTCSEFARSDQPLAPAVLQAAV